MANSKPLPRIPSERTAEIVKRLTKANEQKAQQEKRLKDLRSAAARVAATPEGMFLMQHIAAISGFKKPKLVGNHVMGTHGPLLTSINPEATIVLAAREAVWLELRPLFERTQLNQIED